MKTIFYVVAGIVLMITTILFQPPGVNGQTRVTAYQLRRTVIHVAGGGPSTSGQGRYRQRGSAGAAVRSATFDTARLTGSIGFWWLIKSGDTADGPVRLFLPLIIKSGGAS